MADYRQPSDRYPCGRQQTGQGWMLSNPVFNSAEPRLDKAAHQTTPIDQFLKLRVEAGQAPTPASRQETGSLSGVSGQQLGFPWRLPETD